jgi:transposase InsO family protein
VTVAGRPPPGWSIRVIATRSTSDALHRWPRRRRHCPVGRERGDLYDNALAESVIGLFKTEVIRRKGPWRHLETVEFATLDWVGWFNTRRLLEPISYMPPVKYDAR